MFGGWYISERIKLQLNPSVIVCQGDCPFVSSKLLLAVNFMFHEQIFISLHFTLSVLEMALF